jgi:LysR family hydrogen peroxide-inducible transcriptional activator
MTNLTLRQMRYFEALHKAGHFGRAAEACAISQPALSVQIREMEQDLGAPLFERAARRVTLTGFGEDLAPRIRDILQRVEELSDLAAANRAGDALRLRMGIIPTIAPYLLPRVIARLTLDLPALDLHVRETQTQTLLQELAEGRLDCAILALPTSESWLTETALFDEDFVLVRPADQAGRTVPNAEELAQMRLLLLEEGHCFRDQALAFCAQRPALARDGLDGSSLSTLVQMVSAGIGVTLIPEMAVALETRAATVDLARFRAPAPSRTIGMVWRNTTPLAPRLRQIADSVRSATAPNRP